MSHRWPTRNCQSCRTRSTLWSAPEVALDRRYCRAFSQVRHLLKPDGVFIALFWEATRSSSSVRRCSWPSKSAAGNRQPCPPISVSKAGELQLKARPDRCTIAAVPAGFTLTTVDVEDMTVNYPSIWELMSDLRDMGESNAILGRKAMVSRDVLLAADAIYKVRQTLKRTLLTAELYGTPEGSPPHSR